MAARVDRREFIAVGGELSSEVAGVCFNPAGDRMYFGSQRALGVGAVYEVRGPFRRKKRKQGPKKTGRRRR